MNKQEWRSLDITFLFVDVLERIESDKQEYMSNGKDVML